MSELVQELRAWQERIGSRLEETADAETMTRLLKNAADRIEYLEARVGAVSPGDGEFHTIARNLPRSEPKRNG